MSEQMELFRTLEKDLNFELAPCDRNFDLDAKSGLTKLELTPAQKGKVSALFSQMPAMLASETMAHAYVLKLPEGLSGMNSLMSYRSGGLGTPIMGENGKIVAHASLHGVSDQALLLSCFTAMSIASGQYFLTQIHSELKMMRMNLDKILEFLYGDKKAELMAEISFVKYAYQNYNSIMSHEAQRTATIASIQKAKKVAMKDIEFYMNDLDSAAKTKDNSELISTVNKAFQIKESLNSVYTRSGQNSTPNSNATNLHSSQKRCCSFCISSSNASPTFQVQKSIFHQMTKPIQVTVILPLLLAISLSWNDDIHSSISGISNDLIGVIPTIGQ